MRVMLGKYLSIFTVFLILIGIIPFQVSADSNLTMTGSGTEVDPYMIMTLDHLNAVRNDLGSHYKLGSDIDASETANWNNGEGFIPIGGNGNDNSQFTGVLDGASYVIRNLTINRPTTDLIGLFGIVGSGGTVKNVGLVEVTITGNLYTGSLAGRNLGTIDKSYVSGDVRSMSGLVGGLTGYNNPVGIITNSHTSATVSGVTNYVGGLVGRNDGRVDTSFATGNVSGASIVGGLAGDNEGGEVTHSYATGSVSGSTTIVGGLVGYNIQGIVKQSYATGSVSGQSAVGGLVGIASYGFVSQSYASGTVSGSNYVGGLVGNNSFAKISQSYAIGYVSGTSHVGGLIGLNNGEMVSSFWNTETSDQSIACGYNDDLGICTSDGLTTTQSLKQTSYTGWDFQDIWLIEEGISYPRLQVIDVAPPLISISMETADENHYEDSTWTNQNVTVTASTYDAKSTLTSFAYSIDSGSTWTRYTSSVVLQNDGVYSLWFKAIDTAGNEAVEHRTAKISTSGLMLTPTLKLSNGDAYISGTWTNASVAVSVYAETGAAGIGDLTYTLNNNAMQPYVENAAILVEQEGTNHIEFQLTDRAGNTFPLVLDVNIDKTATSVGFGMNGSESWTQTAQTTVTATDTISGVDPSTLMYAWTTDAAIPASGWTLFTTGDTLSKSGVNGNWYLHIQALDKAGNLVNSVSNRYRMDASVAALIGLSSSEGTLSPAFAASIASYTVSVENKVSYLSIVPLSADATDSLTVTVNDGTAQQIVNGVQSESLALSVGDNIITIRVKALNGLQQTYTITATRSSAGTGSSNVGGNTLPSNTDLVSTEGGTFTFSGGQILIPNGAKKSSFYLTINEVIHTNDLPLSNKEQLISKVIELTKDQAGNFHKEVIISLSFNAGRVQKEDMKISLYWLNEKTNEWVELKNTVVDWEKGTVSGATDHFTKYAVIATHIEQSPVIDGNDVPFPDIHGHWAEVKVQHLVEKGVISGYTDGTFKPNHAITRAEFATFLVRALGLPQREGKAFADTTDHWAKQAIASAYAYGIIHGYNELTFAPDEFITREQMATMMANALQLENVQSNLTFSDQGMISPWAQDAVAAAVGHRVITGYPDNTIKPKAHATRAEAATVIWHAMK